MSWIPTEAWWAENASTNDGVTSLELNGTQEVNYFRDLVTEEGESDSLFDLRRGQAKFYGGESMSVKLSTFLITEEVVAAFVFLAQRGLDGVVRKYGFIAFAPRD